MRYLRLSCLAAAVVACTGCFQMTTTIKVKGDGTGTIDQRLFFAGSALAQIQQFGALAGQNGKPFDPISEEEARADAAKIGPGVTYVTSTAINDASGHGRETTYAFENVNELRVLQRPGAPGGVTVSGGAAAAPITLALSTLENGNALLTIATPPFNLPAMSQPGAAGAGSPSEGQLAMARQVLAGARVTIAVEPAGRLVRTSSPYVEGQRVTLVDISFDELLKDDVMARMREAKTTDDLRAIMKDVPGLKLALDRQTTIEFAR